MNIKAFRALIPKSEFVRSPTAFFSEAKKDFQAFLQNGFYHKTDKKAVYIYFIDTGIKQYSGLLCLTHINDIIKNKILRHENTLAIKEQEMIHTLMQRKALIKPILLTYNQNPNIDGWILRESKKSKPISEFILADGTKHQIFAVTESEKINKVIKLFDKKVIFSVIADGHHRSASIRRLFDLDPKTSKLQVEWFSTVYLSDSSLDILAYNRIIQLREDFPSELFVVLLSQYASIRAIAKARKPDKKHELTMYLNGRWYSISWNKKVINKAIKKSAVLDTQLFNDIILQRILQIEEVKSDPKVEYVPGTKTLLEMEEKTKYVRNRIAFCLFPILTNEFLSAAKNEQMLPPKSTYFLPRLVNGFVAQSLNFET